MNKLTLSEEQQIILTIRGRYKCPLCESKILEVLRTNGEIEEYCTS